MAYGISQTKVGLESAHVPDSCKIQHSSTGRLRKKEKCPSQYLLFLCSFSLCCIYVPLFLRKEDSDFDEKVTFTKFIIKPEC